MFKIEDFLPGDRIEVKVGAWRNTIITGTVLGGGVEGKEDVIDFKVDDDVVTRCPLWWCYLNQVVSHGRVNRENASANGRYNGDGQELCPSCGQVLHLVRENIGDYFHCSVCKAV